MISRVSSISDQDFLTRYALEKKVCLFGSGFTDAWRAMRDWIDPTDGKSVNVEYLQAKYGDDQVRVIVGTETKQVTSKELQEMRFGDFVEKYCGHYRGQDRSAEPAYVMNFPVDKSLYNVPTALKLALYNIGDPGRFIDGKDTTSLVGFFGTKGTWSCFHVDRNGPGCTWSAQVSGRKLWYLVEPGAEEHFRCGPGTDSFLLDIRERRELFQAAGVVEIVQEQGEIIFVPSGWYHQVHNLEDSLTIIYNPKVDV